MLTLLLKDANGEDVEAEKRQRDDGMTDVLEKQTAVLGSLCRAGTTQANAGSRGEEAASLHRS